MTTETMMTRCLDALEMMSTEPQGLSLTVISNKLNLLKSAAHRLVKELEHEGFVVQAQDSQHYKLTTRFATLGFEHLAAIGVGDASKQSLMQLASKTGELVRMALVDEDRLTWVSKAQGASSGLRFDPEMGVDVRLKTTASGRIWLSTFGADGVYSILSKNEMNSITVNKIETFKKNKKFFLELDRTKARGYGISIDEDELGMSAIAVNIFHPTKMNWVIGTVSVAGPTARLQLKHLEAYINPLQKTASILSSAWPNLGQMDSFKTQKE